MVVGPVSLSAVFVSVSAFLVCSNITIALLSTSLTTGPLILMISLMLRDMLMWFVLWAAILPSFFVGLHVVYPGLVSELLWFLCKFSLGFAEYGDRGVEATTSASRDRPSPLTVGSTRAVPAARTASSWS